MRFNKFKFRSKNPNLDMKTGFYNSYFFDLRLSEERRRSERSGLPFSLLTMDISSLSNLIKRHPNLNLVKIKRVITDMVRRNCRSIDLKTWYNNTTLKILLPETAEKDAHVFFEKLQKKIENSFKALFRIENTFDFKKNVMITSFPEVIKNSESVPGSKTKMVNKSKVTPMLSSSNEDNVSTTLTIKWDSLNQTSLTWPLYSDLLAEHSFSNIGKWIKRGIDIASSLIGIVLFSPVMLVIAILIKSTSCGSVLFRQERIGFLGKKFIFLKFRSMYTDCSEEKHKEYVTKLIKNCLNPDNPDPECKPLYKMNDDSRITPLGKFLRKTSLDELPQIFNVLKGEMSLVGPRPPIPYEVEKYESWHLRRVLEVKPGITGLWQVTGRSMTTFDEMVRLDIAYVNNFSLWLDMKILFKTIWVVLSAKGAY